MAIRRLLGRRARLCVSSLENRITPAVWDGGAGDGLWSSPTNWVSDALPGAGEDVTIATAATVTYNSGTAQIHNLTCTAPFAITGGTLEINGTGALTKSFSQSGGTLQGSGAVTFSGASSWSGGAWYGAGKNVFPSGSSLAIDSSATVIFLDTRGVDLSVAATWVGASTFYTGDGAFNVKSGGSLDIQGDGNWAYGSGSGATPINVEFGGKLSRSVSAGSATLAGKVNNAGTLTASTGKLVLSGGGDWTGSASITATLNVSASTLTFKNGVSVTGDGDISLTGGTLSVDTGSSTVAMLSQSGGTLDGPGSLTVSKGWSWSGGTQSGAGKTLIASTAAGTISTVTGPVFLYGRNIEDSGAVAWVGDSVFYTGDGSWTTKSGGKLDIQGDGNWAYGAGSGATPIFNEAGAILSRSVSTGTATVGGAVTNAGTIQVAGGVLSLAGGGEWTGKATLIGDLVLAASKMTIKNGASSTGAGTLLVTGSGTLYVDAGASSVAVLKQSAGIIDGPGTLTIGTSWLWNGGTQQGAGKTTIAATATGTLDSTTGALFHNGRAFDDFGTVKWIGSQPFYTGDGSFNVKSGGKLDVQGDGGWLYGSGSGGMPINVAAGGQLTRTVSAGAATLQGAVNNDGAVTVSTGSLTLSGGGAWTGSAALTGDINLYTTKFTLQNGASITGVGSLVIANAVLYVDTGASSVARLVQNGGTIDGPGTLTITAAWNWTGGSHTGTGKTIIAAAAAGTIDTTSSPVFLSSRAMEDAGSVVWIGDILIYTGDGSWTIKAGGKLEIRGDSNWAYGSGFGAMPITIDAGGLLLRSTGTGTANIDGLVQNNGALQVDAGTLALSQTPTNYSFPTLTGGSYTISGTLKFPGAAIVNNAATITLNGPGSAIQSSAGDDAVVRLTTNAGSFTLTGGRTLTTVDHLDTSGSLNIGAGSALTTSLSMTQTAGSVVVDGTLDPAFSFSATGGTLRGSGIINNQVSTSGLVGAGSSPGILTVNGDFFQSAGTFEVEINGPAAGSGYDRVVVNGKAHVGGTLQVSRSFSPAVGAPFVILANDGSDTTTGTFTGLADGASLLANGLKFQINYNAGDGNDVVLTRLASAVGSVTIDDGNPQRSRVRFVTVAFAGVVTLPANKADGFQLTRVNPASGTPVTLVVDDTTLSTPTQTIVRLTFTGPPALLTSGSLADGKYNLRVFGDLILDAGGQPLDGDANGTPGGTTLVVFSKKFGDANGDGLVDLSDYVAFRGAYGSNSPYYDSDGNGTVDLADYVVFRTNYGSAPF